TVTATSSNTTLVPNGNITVNYTDNGGASANVLSPTLDITPAANLSGTTTITVTVQDNGTGTPSAVETFDLTVNAVNDDPTISAIADQSTNEDTDKTGISFTVDEGGGTDEDAQVLTVTATSSNTTLVPNANITVNYTDNGGASANVLSPTLDITPAANLSGTTTITVTVQDNGTDTPSAVETFDLTVNQVAEYTVSAISGNTDESGSTATFDVVLNSKPDSDVVLNVTSDDNGEGTVDQANLTFTPTNWDTPQTVTVTGVDDDIIDGDITYNMTLSVDDANSDDDFDQLADQTVSVTNTDDDVAGYTLSKTTSTITEGNNDTFTIVLDAEPSSNVVIDLSSDDTGAATVSPSSLTFTSGNWNSTQLVTITSVQDDDLQDETPTITASVNASSDGDFTGLANKNVTITVTDDDIASISISAISGNTREDGTTATFTIVLDSEPIADVTIGLSSDNTAEGTVSPASVTFTSTNWNVVQTVTVTGVDDAIDDGDVVYTIVTAVATSSDANYNGLDPADVTVTNEDNDGVGISVSAISGNTREDGTTATFTIVLDSEPTADVTIGLSSDNTAEGTVSPSSVTFTTANWNIAQTVTVTGVDDAIDDGDVVYTIVTAAATSSDTNYNGLDPADVTVTNEDNDGVGISVSAISGNTREDGTTATFTIVLDSEPTADVTIGLSSDNTAEGTVSPSSVTFTTANWNIAQTVTVTGVDDAIDDGDVVYTIVTAAATSSDTNYNGLDPADVTVTNEDNDGVGISVSAISGNTREDGTTATFTIVLDSEPTADVTIGLSSDNTAEGTVSPASVTFTSTNWNVVQTVTVTGVDDNDVDGDVTYTIIISAASSSDANYNGIDPADIDVINEDDDSIDGTPVITGQVGIPTIDEDTDFTISFTDLTVSDPDNNYPSDHTLILLTGSDYDISGSTIVPKADYNGALKVNLKVSDGVNESNVYEYEVDIRPVNDKPILVADVLTVQFGNTLEGNLLTNDSDIENDGLLLTDISPLPAGLSFNTDGSFIYNGDTEIGTIEMDYVVCDDGDPSECAQSTFTLIIEGGDFDGDGIPDSYEIQFDDVDDDGEPEYRDLDSDNDGISDSQEAGADPENPVDTDQDGTPDFLDTDSDGDGKLDSEEGVEDCDRDGILNYIDNDDPCKMKIADAFSPNGDGKNDEWIIQGIESYPENKVTIFNRWGNKIFEIDGYDNNSRVWRGEINTNIGSDKNAPYSTYYFIIDLKDGSKPIAGNILISK
ncbi:gliding motility-associated C-terminal domain-containing protein, partial [Ekhidna lutea]